MVTETQALTVQSPAELLEKVLIGGDLAKLTPAERMSYYNRVCESVAVNPYTRPFEYITLNGKLTLYARRDCTDQLRESRHVNAAIVSREKMDDIYVVTARATRLDPAAPGGVRTDESIGAVNIGGLKGDALANALMKAETKAKRRVTLSIVGLGFLDETEVESVPGAQAYVEPETPKSNGHTPQPVAKQEENPTTPNDAVLARPGQILTFNNERKAALELGLSDEELPKLSDAPTLKQLQTQMSLLRVTVQEYITKNSDDYAQLEQGSLAHS